MKNPLAIFTGAALATLAALAGLKTTNWPASSTISQNAPETVKEAQKPAAEETTKTPEKQVETAAIPAPEPPKAEAEVKPELDTVRVESDGQAIVAGRAKPGAEVSLKLGDQVIGKGIANPDGSWVVVPDNPLPKGAHELTIEQKAADSAPVASEQSIAFAIPEKAGQQAMVALTKPGAATKVLQSGEDQQQQASASPATAEPAVPEQPEPVETAEKPAESAEPSGQAEQPAARTTAQPAPNTTAMAKTEILPEAVKPVETTPAKPEPAKTAKIVPLRLDAVDYNDKGDIIFSGRAPPGTAIRLYVDNRSVGDAIVDSEGNWFFSGKDIIAPGTHNLRADQIDNSGKVMARIELPFLREDAAAVAALNSPPAPEKTEAKPAQTSEAQPAPTTEAQPQPTAEAPPQPTVEAEPQQTAEVAKTEPEAPAPDQPVAADKKADKKEDVTTAVAAAAEQAAKVIDPDKARSGRVVIQPGNNLWKLSRVIYGRGINFTVIYNANKDQIRNPNRIYPGQIFAIPNATPPESIDPKRKDPLTSAEGGAAQ